MKVESIEIFLTFNSAFFFWKLSVEMGREKTKCLLANAACYACTVFYYEKTEGI